MEKQSESTAVLLKDFMEATENKANEQQPETVVIEADPAPAETKAVDIDKAPAPAAQPMLSPETQAEIYIGIADTTQGVVFGAINRRKMKRRLGDRLELAEKIYSDIDFGREQIVNLSDEHHQLYLRIKGLMEVAETIPFSDDEYEKLKVPLSKIIQESGHDLPPSMALTLLALQIFAPRISDAFFE